MCTRKGYATSVSQLRWQRLCYISHFSNRRLGAKDPLSSRRRFIQSFLRKYSVLSLPDATVLTSRIKSPRARDSW